MKINYVFIDYENVKTSIGERLASDVFKMFLFVSPLQSRVNFDIAQALQRKGDAAQYIKVGAAGKNALDFHIAYYIGSIAAKEPDAYFHVITEDKGLDPLIEHLCAADLKVSHHSTIEEIPILKADASNPRDDKLSSIIEYLVRRGKQRPATMKTLQGSVSALFQPKLDPEETSSLLQELQKQGIFHCDQSKVVYGLPE